jgi:aminopeptidase 2
LLKATFAVTLISRADTVNLSNMPAVSEEVYTGSKGEGNANLADLFSSLTITDGKWKITKFQTTPLMSSYIVAFANGHFEYLEKSIVMPLSGKTLPMRIYGLLRFNRDQIRSDFCVGQLRLITSIKPNLRWM